MRRRTLIILATALAVGAVVPSTVAAKGHPRARYYLSLGDSLSQGMQPNVQGETKNTNQGYADDIFAAERGRVRHLHLVKLGCGGESSASMVTGTGNVANPHRAQCPRTPGGSQLAAAERFLRAHHRRGEVPLVTLDIGANDVDRCASAANVGACVTQGEAAISKYLPIILRGLRKAAPKGTVLAAMTLYDPVLGGYFSTNPTTKSLALASPAILKSINGELSGDDAKYGFLTADVATAFHSYDGTTMVSWENQSIPANVGYVCSWTWACTTPPSGPNIHANKNGYLVIARTFEKVIGRLR